MKKLIVLATLFFGLFHSNIRAQGWVYSSDTPPMEYEYGLMSALTPDSQLLALSMYTNNNTAVRMRKMSLAREVIWQKDYPTFYQPGNHSLKVRPDGDYYFLSVDSLYHFDAEGDPIWARKTFMGFSFQAVDIVYNSEGPVVAFIRNSASENIDSVFLAQYNWDGIPVGAPLKAPFATPGSKFAIWADLAMLPDGSFVAGAQRVQGPDSLAFTRISPGGSTIFTTYIGYAAGTSVNGERIIAAGSDVVVGLSLGGQYVPHLMKLDGQTGQVIWEKVLNTIPGNNIADLALAADGGVVATGKSLSQQIYALKLDVSGSLQWYRKYTPDSWQEASGNHILKSPDGGYVITGFKSENGDAFSYIIKTDEEGYIYPNAIRGRLYLDQNVNCQPEPGADSTLSGWTVQAGDFFSVTDSTGWFEIRCDTGTFEVYAVPPGAYWSACTPAPVVSFSQFYSADTVDLAAIIEVFCPMMDVHLATWRIRNCFENTWTVNYCNRGTVTAQSSVRIILPPELDFIEAEWPPAQMSGDTLWFDLGNVASLECGQFWLKAFADCDSTYLGQTLCVEAHIYPDTFCNPAANWSGASIQVSATCVGDTVARFNIRNIGVAPSQVLDYLIGEDHVVLLIGNFMLNSQEEMEHSITATGHFYRIVAEQEPNHPGISMPTAFIEGCGGGANGFPLQFPSDDGNLFVDLDCREVVGSYDPNDKQGFPTGYDSGHYIEPGTPLTYLVRFQNTGTDTAFIVTVRDTLSKWLDPATLRPGAASHPYTWTLEGEGVAVFTFKNILLPDSNVNESASHGYVQFEISPKTDVPLETLVQNRAAIFFDFNEPVITNETWHTIGQNFVFVHLSEPEQPAWSDIEVAPNPFSTQTVLTLKNGSAGEKCLRLFDAGGRAVYEKTFTGRQMIFNREGLPKGMYWLEISENGRVTGKGKVMAY